MASSCLRHPGRGHARNRSGGRAPLRWRTRVPAGGWRERARRRRRRRSAAMSDPAVFAVFGPTASGKSAVAEALAQQIDAELVSADSAQVYRGLPILTNQPSTPTHLVAVWDLDREVS